MNRQAPTPMRTQHLIASPVRRNLPGQRPAASRPGWDAYPYLDEESLGDPAGVIILSHPELFCPPAVAPDELQPGVDGFLS